MTNNELIDECIVILQTMNAEDCAAAIDELRDEVFAVGAASCADFADLRSAEAKATAAEEARLKAAEEARWNAAEKARLQAAADRFAVNKTKAVGGFIDSLASGGFIDSLASCNTTSILLVGAWFIFAIFCTILFTIASQRSI